MMRKGKLEKEIFMMGALVVLVYVVYRYYEKSKEQPLEKECRRAFQEQIIRMIQQKKTFNPKPEHYERYKLNNC